MEVVINRSVRVEFADVCSMCGRDDVTKTVIQQLTFGDDTCLEPIDDVNSGAKSNAIMIGILSRLERGNTDDLRAFIEEHFSIPLGLQISLLQILRRAYDAEKHNQILSPKAKNSSYVIQKQLAEPSNFLAVWTNWKTGKISPNEYFAQLHALVESKEIEPITVQRLIAIYLSNAGYGHLLNKQHANRSSVTSSRSFIATSNLCDLVEITKIVSHLSPFSKNEVNSSD